MQVGQNQLFLFLVYPVQQHQEYLQRYNIIIGLFFKEIIILYIYIYRPFLCTKFQEKLFNLKKNFFCKVIKNTYLVIILSPIFFNFWPWRPKGYSLYSYVSNFQGHFNFLTFFFFFLRELFLIPLSCYSVTLFHFVVLKGRRVIYLYTIQTQHTSNIQVIFMYNVSGTLTNF